MPLPLKRKMLQQCMEKKVAIICQTCAHTIVYSNEWRTRLYSRTMPQLVLFYVPGPNKNRVSLSDIISASAFQACWVIIIAAARLNLLQTHSKALQYPLFPVSERLTPDCRTVERDDGEVLLPFWDLEMACHGLKCNFRAHHPRRGEL